MPILDIRNLRKTFGDVEVLRDISVSMEPGEFLVLLGGSGCGKSTLLNCIAGLEEVTAGDIDIDGTWMNETPPKDRDIAMVFQSYALYPNMTVAQNICFGMKVRRTPKPEQDAKLAEVARILQIEPLLERKPAELSGGQRQRVAIGRALVRAPKLFLFDEPLSNLDARLRGDMRAEIRNLHQSVGASIVYVTHDQIEAMTLATKVVILEKGVVQQVGTPAEIYNRPANTFVAEFIGSPPMNILEIAACRAAGLTVEAPAGTAHVGIRPEDLAPASEGMSMRVLSVEDTGADQYVKLAVSEGRPMIARIPSRQPVRKDEEIPLRIAPNALHFFDSDGQRIL